MANGDDSLDMGPPIALPPVIRDLSSRLRVAPPLPDAPPPDTPSDLGRKPPAVSPAGIFNAPRRWDLTVHQTPPAPDSTPGGIIAAPPPTPSYAEAAVDPNTGQPNPASPNLTRLGKVFTLLTMLGKGAAEGSAGRNFGQGFELARQAQQQDVANYQQAQERGLNTQIQRMKLAEMPWEIARQHQVSDLDLQIKQAQARGEHPVYTREADGSYTLQNYDRDNNPIGKPIRNIGTGGAVAAAAKPPHLQSKAILNPHDANDTVPYAANYNNITGQYEELNGSPIEGTVRPFPAAQISKATPQAGTPAAAVAAQVGPRPRGTTYNGQNYTSNAEAIAAWGKDQQKLITKMKQDAAMGMLQPGDVQTIGEGIISGNLAPDLKNMGRGGAAGAVQAYIARKGFKLANAQRDWNATLSYYKNLNNAQQVRLGQNVRNADGMLDRIEQLYGEWQRQGLATGVKVFNRAALEGAKNLPGEAGKTATMLDQQIAEFTADMGNVLMGGNSPTDHALQLAGQIMNGAWNQDTFEGAVKNAHWNIRNRRNAIEGGSPVGVSSESPYAPPAPTTPANNQKQSNKPSFGVRID
jgi:hypothetical protein